MAADVTQEHDALLLAATREERRARREARRAKQREANILRAAKMHLARVAYSANATALPGDVGEKPQFNIGCSGWFYWHWREQFYPRELPTNQWFSHYSSQFRTVELNAPFYSWPTIANVQSWIKQAGRRRFHYTVKVCELITHVKRLRRTHELVRDFSFIADLLGSRMGCFLFQFPPSHRYTAARLRAIVSQLVHSRRNVVEFRHASWWNENVYSACREHGIIFCSTSGPRLPDVLIKTADDIYVRFHGTKRWYRHDYSKVELQEWAARIHDSGAKTVWGYFNNDRDGHAIRNAKTLRAMLK